MAGFPTSAGGVSHVTYPVGPTTLGVEFAASSTAHTRGAYAEVAASAAITSSWVHITLQDQGTTSGAGFARLDLIDLATGAAASETVVVPDLMSCDLGPVTMCGSRVIRLPWRIPSGSRVAARSQSTFSSHGGRLAITMMSTPGTTGIESFTTYGQDATGSNGQELDPGAVANTKGAYAEVKDSTGVIFQYANVQLSIGANTQPVNARWYVDLATGAASSEVVLIPDLPRALGVTGTTAGSSHGDTFGFFTYIASGTRLAARASVNITDSADRRIEIVVTGAPEPASSGKDYLLVLGVT